MTPPSITQIAGKAVLVLLAVFTLWLGIRWSVHTYGDARVQADRAERAEQVTQASAARAKANTKADVKQAQDRAVLASPVRFKINTLRENTYAPTSGACPDAAWIGLLNDSISSANYAVRSASSMP